MIYVYPADTYGCGHYRLIWPGLELARQGHDVRVVPPSDRHAIQGDIDSRTDKLVNIAVPEDAEAIVIQRPTLSYMADAVRLLREQRSPVAVIVDMDDDLRSIDPSNPAFWAMHPRAGYRQHSGANAMAACRDATMVTVTSPALAGVYGDRTAGRDQRVVTLPNQVPAGWLDIPRVDGAVMSWPGSTHSHPHDLQQVGPAVARLLAEGHRYRAIGSPVGVREALALGGDWAEDATGDVDFAQWPWAVAEIGVGLAPLADTIFNAAKSWLKPLEMSAVGVPWVASPRAEYSRLHHDFGVGLLAKDPREWHRHLRALVTSEALRAEQSAAGRAAAAANTYEGSAWRWLEAWRGAIEMAQGRARERVMIT